MGSIGDKLIYPAYNKYGYIPECGEQVIGMTYKEALILRISNTSHSAASVVNKANNIIAILDEEREQNVTKSK